MAAPHHRPAQATAAGRLTAALPSRSAARITGLSLRQLRYLAQTGVASPSIRWRQGPGHDNLYAAADLLALALVVRVRAICGTTVSTERLRAVVKAAQSPHHPRQQFLVFDGVISSTAAAGLGEAMNGRAGVLVLDLDAIAREIRDRAREATWVFAASRPERANRRARL